MNFLKTFLLAIVCVQGIYASEDIPAKYKIFTTKINGKDQRTFGARIKLRGGMIVSQSDLYKKPGSLRGKLSGSVEFEDRCVMYEYLVSDSSIEVIAFLTKKDLFESYYEFEQSFTEYRRYNPNCVNETATSFFVNKIHTLHIVAYKIVEDNPALKTEYVLFRDIKNRALTAQMRSEFAEQIIDQEQV